MNSRHNMLSEWYNNLTDAIDRFRYVKEVGIALAVLLAGGVLYGGYRYYMSVREAEAQELFMKDVEEYKQATQNGGDWARISTLFEQGGTLYKGTITAPYFYAYQAQALARDQKLSEAIVLMDDAVNLTSRSNPIRSLFIINRALMILDAGLADRQAQAITDLEEIGKNSRDIVSDMALFYLGKYYWHIDDLSAAARVWNELIQRGKLDRHMPSPWAGFAEPLFEQLFPQIVQHI